MTEQTELLEKSKVLEALEDCYYLSNDGVDSIRHCIDAVNDLPPRPAVAVKPLEWVDEGVRCYAESVLGNWFVWDEGYIGPGDYAGTLCKPGTECETAEKEYQRRMAPALSPQPPVTPEQAARVLLEARPNIPENTMISKWLRAIAGGDGHV